ncbi:signal peptidase II [Brevibacterium spongiae]|uniref:Lipoprotein signal peptidase n=1 Tax=Brevibacterium spongiae TaxID=2909672 RepID=A0ABY5SK25_9MICO|nr:signal peptidase II [Brevibacterium spongiae]UVI34630.1 signal peptidase II [Brevibacterium spongiae]
MNEPVSQAKRSRAAMLVLLFSIAAIVLVVDQFTKFLAVSLLEDRPPVPVIGTLAGFNFYRNPGAAFGLGSSVTWVFPLIAIGVFAAILVLSRKLGSRSWAIGLGLLLGGLFGNLVDRLFREPGFLHGAVVDFIDLSLFMCNVADIAISAAAVTLVIVSLKGIELDGSTSTRVKKDSHD